MIIGSIFVILCMIYFIWVACAQLKKAKYDKEYQNITETKEYKEWKKTNAPLHVSVRSVEDYYRRFIWDVQDPGKPNHMIAHAVFFGIMILFCAGIWLGINSDNVNRKNIATNRATIYQEFVDAEDMAFLSCGGCEKILGFNDTVLAERACQDHWYYKFYHLFGDDWYEVPLVTFKK